MALLQGRELLEGERVHGPHEAQLALELTHARRGRRGRRELGTLGGHGRLGLAVEVAAHGLDSRLQTHAGLGLVELGPPSPLADLFQPALSAGALGPHRVEP